MKYLTAFLLILILVFSLQLLLLVSCNNKEMIYVNKNKSFFSDFEVENDTVFIKCHITLTNTYSDEKSVILSACLPEDVAVGLLRSEEVKALNEDGTEFVFILPPNESKSFDVVFVGEYAGIYKKHDKGLPEINISIVK